MSRTCAGRFSGAFGRRSSLGLALASLALCGCSDEQCDGTDGTSNVIEVFSDEATIDRIDLEGPCALVACPGDSRYDAAPTACVEHPPKDKATSCQVTVVFDVPSHPTQECSFGFIYYNVCARPYLRRFDVERGGGDSFWCCEESRECKSRATPVDAGSGSPPDAALDLDVSVGE